MPGEGIGDHERRRGEEVHPHLGMHPALEVAVAGEHRAGRDVTGLHAGGDLRLERPGVADAGGAAVAHEVEADSGKIVEHAGAREVVGDDA